MRLSSFNTSLTDTWAWRSIATFQDQILLRTKEKNQTNLDFHSTFIYSGFHAACILKKLNRKRSLRARLDRDLQDMAGCHLHNVDIPTTLWVSLFQHKSLGPRRGFPCWGQPRLSCAVPARESPRGSVTPGSASRYLQRLLAEPDLLPHCSSCPAQWPTLTIGCLEYLGSPI